MSLEPHTNERLQHIANNVLKQAPFEALPLPLVESLEVPTVSALCNTGFALLSENHLDAAETMFRALIDWPDIDPCVASGLERVSARGNWEKSVSAWQNCLRMFPDRAELWWFLELARAERQRGNHIEAEAQLRQCRARFPRFGPAAATLAELLGTLGRHEECLAAWQAVFREFSETVEPWWFLGLARAERQHGNHIEAEAQLRQCRARFPRFGPAAATLAELLGTLGRHEECLAAWQAVFREFSETVEPWWFLGLARAERQHGNHIEAEAQLRQCRARFPRFGPAAATLAELLGTLGRHEECLAAWQAVFREFSETVEPWWFLGFAASLRALGCDERAERVLDDMGERFPAIPETLVHQAETAANSENWADALNLWTACIDRHMPETKPEWLNGQAIALFRLWRVEEALDVWKYLIKCFPEFIPGRTYLATAVRELGLWATMRQCFAELIARFPNRVTPDWFAEQARGLLYERSEQSANRAIVELDKNFPDSPHGSNLSIEFCYFMHLGVNVMLPQIEAALRRFPNDCYLLGEHVRALLASGRLQEAEAVVTHLEALGNNYQALMSRWRVIMDRNGEGALEGSARHALTGRDWTPESGLAIGDFLLSLSSAWAAELAQDLFNNLAAKFPGRAAIVCAQARALIALRRDQLALRLIDSLPAAYQTREILEVRAWASFRRGEHAQAKDLWQTILSRNYFPALHSAEPKLELLTPGRDALPLNGVTAFVNIRNEMAHLPEFLRHHRNIGVVRFVFVDNMSTDDSANYLHSQPDVILYRTQDAFQTSSAGMRWVNVLRERHGATGWSLYVDADEAFIYPGWETTPLSRLTDYLETEGAEGVAAFMLDVYPKRLLDKAGKPSTQVDYRYYDANYAWIGQVRAPYAQPIGGVRWRLFRVHETLHKVPLIRQGSGHHVNSHNTTPLRFAQISALLVHYKLLNLALRFGPTGLCAGGNPFMTSRMPDLMRRHMRYAARIGKLMNADLLKPNLSMTLTDSLILADRGLMRAPTEFRQWLHAEAL